MEKHRHCVLRLRGQALPAVKGKERRAKSENQRTSALHYALCAASACDRGPQAYPGGLVPGKESRDDTKTGASKLYGVKEQRH
jgi:hypothetical protein